MFETLSPVCHSRCKSTNWLFYSRHLAPLAFPSSHNVWEETLMMNFFKSHFGGLQSVTVKIFHSDTNMSRRNKTRVRSWRVFTTASVWNKEPDRPTDQLCLPSLWRYASTMAEKTESEIEDKPGRKLIPQNNISPETKFSFFLNFIFPFAQTALP